MNGEKTHQEICEALIERWEKRSHFHEARARAARSHGSFERAAQEHELRDLSEAAAVNIRFALAGSIPTPAGVPKPGEGSDGGGAEQAAEPSGEVLDPLYLSPGSTLQGVSRSQESAEVIDVRQRLGGQGPPEHGS